MTALAIAASMLVAIAPPASAATDDQPPLISWAYTDSATPNTGHANPTGSVPLGRWVDAARKVHVSRIYATFNLAGLSGRSVADAGIYFRTTDCGREPVEMWEVTNPAVTPTWANHPALVKRLAHIGGYYSCSVDLRGGLTEALQTAIASGRTEFSIELRVPSALPPQGRRRLPRWHFPGVRWVSGAEKLQLFLLANLPPKVDETLLFNNAMPCTATTPYRYVGGGDLTLQAMVRDPDSSGPGTLNVQFAVWPVNQPQLRTELPAQGGSNGFVQWQAVPSGLIQDGATYAWSARVSDESASSAWSSPCYFVSDEVGFSAAPVVARVNPTPVPCGSPVTITIDGGPDAVEYEYGWGSSLGVPVYGIGPYGVPIWTDPFDQDTFVHVPTPGTPVTVTLQAPNTFCQLLVRSWDRAYNPSYTTTFEIDIDPKLS